MQLDRCCAGKAILQLGGIDHDHSPSPKLQIASAYARWRFDPAAGHPRARFDAPDEAHGRLSHVLLFSRAWRKMQSEIRTTLSSNRMDRSHDGT